MCCPGRERGAAPNRLLSAHHTRTPREGARALCVGSSQRVNVAIRSTFRLQLEVDTAAPARWEEAGGKRRPTAPARRRGAAPWLRLGCLQRWCVWGAAQHCCFGLRGDGNTARASVSPPPRRCPPLALPISLTPARTAWLWWCDVCAEAIISSASFFCDRADRLRFEAPKKED